MATKAKVIYMHKGGEYISAGSKDVKPFKAQGWQIVPFKQHVEHDEDGNVIRKWKTQDLKGLKKQAVKADKKEEGKKDDK